VSTVHYTAHYSSSQYAVTITIEQQYHQNSRFLELKETVFAVRKIGQSKQTKNNLYSS
jgi:hypothetical protein